MQVTDKNLRHELSGLAAMAKPLVRQLRIFFSALQLTSFPLSPLRRIALPLLTFLLGLCLNRSSPSISSNITQLSKFARFSIPLTDRYSTATETYGFIVSTGRSGTQHLSFLLTPTSPPFPKAYITHEEEHLTSHARFVVSEVYRLLAALPPDKFNTSAETYVRDVKIPFYQALMRRHDAQRLVYTGHLPFAFGLGPALLRQLEGRVRLVRIRRDRLATALSLMALGPENEDPWSSGKHRRWFPSPTDGMVALMVAPDIWGKLNRFQRYLWYVDDFECRWQGILSEFGGRIAWMEESLESLDSFDGGKGWTRVAQFLGVGIDRSRMGRRDNSIQKKGRDKINEPERVLRSWDMRYRKLVGICNIDGRYTWDARQSSMG